MKLTKRLSVIASYIPAGSIVADIGTDHAYLPVYLVLEGIAPEAIATDIHNAPFQSALKTVEGHCLLNKISVRLGNGLEVLRPGEADVIVVAGIGGRNMEEVFEKAPEVLRQTKRLVLQPMTAVDMVRQWLWDHNWQIVDEDLLKEDEKFYQVLVAEPGKDLYKGDPEFGINLIKKGHPLMGELLQKREIQYVQALKGIKKQAKTENKEKEQQVEAKLMMIQRVKEQWLNAQKSIK